MDSIPAGWHVNRPLLINQGLFQLAWPACVIGAAWNLAWTGMLVVGALVIYQLRTPNRHPRDLCIMGICIGTGLVLDTAWIRFGLLEYAMPWPSTHIAPFWILLLWLALALVINHSMRVFKRRLVLLGLLGAVGSPLSYFAGSRFGAVEWVAPSWQVIAATGLSWAMVLPLLFWLARERRPKKPMVYGSGT